MKKTVTIIGGVLLRSSRQMFLLVCGRFTQLLRVLANFPDSSSKFWSRARWNRHNAVFIYDALVAAPETSALFRCFCSIVQPKSGENKPLSSFFGGIYSSFLSFCLREAVSVGTSTPPCTVGRAASPASPRSSSLPLLRCLNTSAVMWELRLRWERTPTLLSFLKIDEKHLDWSCFGGGGTTRVQCSKAACR